jgi:hypothetical protein
MKMGIIMRSGFRDKYCVPGIERGERKNEKEDN